MKRCFSVPQPSVSRCGTGVCRLIFFSPLHTYQLAVINAVALHIAACKYDFCFIFFFYNYFFRAYPNRNFHLLYDGIAHYSVANGHHGIGHSTSCQFFGLLLAIDGKGNTHKPAYGGSCCRCHPGDASGPVRQFAHRQCVILLVAQAACRLSKLLFEPCVQLIYLFHIDAIFV